LHKRKLLYLVVAIVVLIIGIKVIVGNYYQLNGPVFPEHYLYRSTDRGGADIRLYYFTDKDSRWTITEIKQPTGDKVEFKVIDTNAESYSRYYDRHTVYIEATARQPGKSEFDELTFVFNGGIEQTVAIGNLTLDFREPTGSTGKFEVLASGSSNTNRDFTQYQATEPLTLKKVHYELPGELNEILRIVAYPDDIELAENERNSQELLKFDATDEPALQNRDLAIQLEQGQTLILASYFDFTGSGLSELEDNIHIQVDSQVVFVDGTGQEIMASYDSDYVPYLESGEIRAMAQTGLNK